MINSRQSLVDLEFGFLLVCASQRILVRNNILFVSVHGADCQICASLSLFSLCYAETDGKDFWAGAHQSWVTHFRCSLGVISLPYKIFMVSLYGYGNSPSNHSASGCPALLACMHAYTYIHTQSMLKSVILCWDSTEDNIAH